MNKTLVITLFAVLAVSVAFGQASTPTKPSYPPAKTDDAKPAEKYDCTPEEAIELKEAQMQYALASQAKTIAEQGYIATANRIHDAHGWPADSRYSREFSQAAAPAVKMPQSKLAD